jgi:signal transduction histidine kinase
MKKTKASFTSTKRVLRKVPAKRIKNLRTPEVPNVKKGTEVMRLELAREIHDEIGQPLTAAKLILERLRISPDNSVLLLEQVRSLINEAQVKAGSLCRELQDEQPKGTSASRKIRG